MIDVRTAPPIDTTGLGEKPKMSQMPESRSGGQGLTVSCHAAPSPAIYVGALARVTVVTAPRRFCWRAVRAARRVAGADQQVDQRVLVAAEHCLQNRQHEHG